MLPITPNPSLIKSIRLETVNYEKTGATYNYKVLCQNINKLVIVMADRITGFV